LLKFSELGLLKNIIRGIALTDKELGLTKRKSQKSFTAVLGIYDSWPDETKTERASWPVADKGLTINEKNICLVVISVPDIYSSISLSMGYPPRLMGADGRRLTELQPETIGKAFSEILFPGKRRNMPCGFVWRGCSRNCPDRISARKNRSDIHCNSVSAITTQYALFNKESRCGNIP
jgi:hypothetical protein